MFQRKKDETASVKSKADSHFKVVAKRDSVLLPAHGHPAGWVNRQSERAEKAKEGVVHLFEAEVMVTGFLRVRGESRGLSLTGLELQYLVLHQLVQVALIAKKGQRMPNLTDYA